MSIIWNERDDDWQDQYGIDDDLADEIADHQDRGFHALEYGPAKEAVRCFAWLTEQWSRIAGPRDDTTMVQRAFLARAFAADGQTLLAADELRRLVVDRAAVLGEDDPQTLRTRGQLGQVLARGGYPDEAIDVLADLWEDRVRLFGPDDPSVFDTVGNLAEAMLLGHHYVEGREMYEMLLEDRTRVLGPEHPDTVRTSLNLAAARAKSCDDPREAIAVAELAVIEMDEIHGPIDDATFTARGHLADALLRAGDLTEARDVLENLLIDRTVFLGPEHPSTLRTVQTLAEVDGRIAGID